MEVPYTPTSTDALLAAQASVGATLTALVWYRPLRAPAATAAFLGAVWIAALTPVASLAYSTVGATYTTASTNTLLHVAAALATLAMLLNRPRWLAAPALTGQLAVLWIGAQLKSSEDELAALHLVLFAALFAGHWRVNWPGDRPIERLSPARSRAREDLLLGLVAAVLATLVATLVLERACDGADEWAYNWQALVFARFKAFVPAPSCPEPHRSHWVFFYEGRAFSMYLPGWPLFMAPFARAGVPWLAGPVTFGAMVVGIARIARRAGGDAAGRIAAAAAMLGAATLMNAGSRYCHVFVAATFAWMVEAVCAATTPDLRGRAQLGWGLVLGSATSLCLCTRPSDGGVLGCGVFLYFAYALARGRIRWRTLTGTTVAFALVCGLTLIILKAQLGVWFKTGYDIADQYWAWAKPTFNIPARDAWKFGIPLATAAYCFFPASPAIAATGLLMAGRRVGFMLGLATALHLTFYSALTFGRYRDFGYGPRFHLPLVVTMAVGVGVALAPLARGLASRWRSDAPGVPSGPATLAAAAFVAGVLRIAPHMYPHAHELLHERSALFRALERDAPKHAVVFVNSAPLLRVQNDPLDPDPPVILLGDADPQCTRALYRDRKFYRAIGSDEVTLVPLDLPP